MSRSMRLDKEVIRLSVHGHRLTIDPDPKTVQLGAPVNWELHVDGLASRDVVRASVLFRDGSPFRNSKFDIEVRTDSNGSAAAPIDAGRANEPGDFKYDVEIAGAGVEIDIDPRLIVLG